MSITNGVFTLTDPIHSYSTSDSDTVKVSIGILPESDTLSESESGSVNAP